MFGYFRPFEAMSHSAERRAFTAHYCRLCYCLRSLGGQKARAFTTFDATIYGMIYCISTKQPSPPFMPCEKIKKNNMRRFSSDELGMKLARISLIAFGEKLRDDKIDGDHRFKTAFVNLLYGRMIRRAEETESEITENSRKGTDSINELQAAGAGLHEVLGAYGRSVAGTFLCVGEMSEDGYNLIRALAEWTFFVDMLCDYDEDAAEGKPNTLYVPGCPTLRDYFDNNYEFILKENKRITDAVMEPLVRLENGTNDWKALHTIIVHALDTVVRELVGGEDIKFKYFKELGKNYKSMHENNKQRKKIGEKDF